MTCYLLDVNILLALFWESHQSHALVKRWFEEDGHHSFATCALTQSGFVRLSSNLAYTKSAVSVREAIAILSTITDLPGHSFWPLDVAIREVAAPFNVGSLGHKQVTDIYLLGQAIQNNGTLATMDSGIRQLAGNDFGTHVLLLQ